MKPDHTVTRLQRTIALASLFSQASTPPEHHGEILELLSPNSGASWAATYHFHDELIQMSALWKASQVGSCQLCQTTMPLSAIPPRVLEALKLQNKLVVEGSAHWEDYLWLPDLPTKENSNLELYPFYNGDKLQTLTVFLFGDPAQRAAKEPMEENSQWIDQMMGIYNSSLQRTFKCQSIKEKVHFKDTIYPVIAHDLRDAIGSIFMLLESIPQECIASVERRKLFAMAQNSSREAYYLLDKLLKWSRSSQQKLKVTPKRVDLGDIIDSTVEILQSSAANKGVELKLNYPSLPHKRATTTDPDMLGSVLRNLISNSLKFTPSGGEVRITLERPSEDLWQIEVRDTGRGMEKEELKKLLDHNQHFSRYGTSGEKGTGLGFILSHRFTRLLGCTLEIDSQKGKGTSVRITYSPTNANKD